MREFADTILHDADLHRAKLLAWSVHLFTASGAVWGMMALLALSDYNWAAALSWMAAALFVDSFDGILARRFRVKEMLPEFDGALLDNMIDYFNYVVVPAVFLYYTGILPPQWEVVGPALILLSSAYQFCQSDAKTDDHFFKGFPSYWNLVVFYMLILKGNVWINLAVILFLSIMVFVPLRYVYPSRYKPYQRLTMAVLSVWGVANIAIVVQLPEPAPILVAISLAGVGYYVLLSLWTMFQSR